MTGSERDAATAMRYFRALLDDFREVGDGAGGDDVVSHDSGYAMRTYAAYAALGYDWLYDAPGMTAELRAHARARFAAWTGWYRRRGYLRDTPATNYHAGYAFAATLIAIAQAGDTGPAGDELWRHVVGELFGRELRDAIATGALDGGDWPEGWQYGPLSVLEYLLAGRALREQGVGLDYLQTWAEAVVVRHVHALSPDGRGTFVGGDTEVAAPAIAPSPRTLLAVVASGEVGRAASWAAAEVAALGLEEVELPVFAALAEARGAAPTPFPRERTRRWYLARGTGTFFARSDWSEGAAFLVAQCAPQRVPDHQHVAAGNVALGRGSDWLVVDPSPYGSLSTLTGNAPAIASTGLPTDYRPSQGPWGQRTRFSWVGQSASGLAVARCDYADQFRFRNRETGVASALRDLVFAPRDDGAVVVVVDRVVTGDATRPLLLRFRTPTRLTRIDGGARGTVGASTVAIRRVASSAGTGVIRAMPTDGNCWDGPRGTCELARLPGDEYRLAVAAAAPVAIHVIDAAPADGELVVAEPLAGPDYIGAALRRGDRSVAVIATSLATAPVVYRAPASATHVVLDAGRGVDGGGVTGARVDGACEVTLAPRAEGAADAARSPLVLSVSPKCEVVEEPASGAAAGPPLGLPAAADGAGRRVGSRGCRGCAETGGVPGGAAWLAAIAAVGLSRRRR